ncbi:Cmp-N-Acetylneuraminate-Beta-1,4-Galactoside Alpha-2,3-Sialyltransferase [Manis pentadactyla]|nr:Cmp-N-Acetylneuraminate-Beta-1,4-Galactoside Alpha-2,3-Sialyltransferase [Manis pentadactyla]
MSRRGVVGMLSPKEKGHITRLELDQPPKETQKPLSTCDILCHLMGLCSGALACRPTRKSQFETRQHSKTGRDSQRQIQFWENTEKTDYKENPQFAFCFPSPYRGGKNWFAGSNTGMPSAQQGSTAAVPWDAWQETCAARSPGCMPAELQSKQDEWAELVLSSKAIESRLLEALILFCEVVAAVLRLESAGGWLMASLMGPCQEASEPSKEEAKQAVDLSSVIKCVWGSSAQWRFSGSGEDLDSSWRDDLFCSFAEAKPHVLRIQEDEKSVVLAGETRQMLIDGMSERLAFGIRHDQSLEQVRLKVSQMFGTKIAVSLTDLNWNPGFTTEEMGNLTNDSLRSCVKSEGIR